MQSKILSETKQISVNPDPFELAERLKIFNRPRAPFSLGGYISETRRTTTSELKFGLILSHSFLLSSSSVILI